VGRVSVLNASIASGEAVLRFPYDERLRQLLRAIPGRRWDPQARVWCVPLDPEGAEALARLLASLPAEPHVSGELTRMLARRRARRRAGECVLDLARPDGEWWLSFATDTAPEQAARLLEHPDGYSLPTIGRALIPLDDRAAALVATLQQRGARLRLTESAREALHELGRRADLPGGAVLRADPAAREAVLSTAAPAPPLGGAPGAAGHPRAALALGGAAGRPEDAPGAAPARVGHDVELRRDRRGRQWIVLAPEHAPLARVLAGRAGLSSGEATGGMFALAAGEPDAREIAALLDQVEPASVDPRVERWLARATEWRGTIEVAGSREAPVFLLLGEVARLPPDVRECATSVPGGATVPLTAAHWQLLEEALRGWISPATRRCVTALRDGRPAPPASLELSPLHEEPTFVLAPGHEPAQLEAFAALPGAHLARQRRGAGPARHEHARLPALRADPFCVPELDEFLAAHGTWVEPQALAALQELREQHAHSAGLVALSAATDAQLDVPGLGGELKPFQRAGVRYVLSQRRTFLADEQGLGKTIEALAALQADGAYPAVVVCPASLKLNWLREIERWLPARGVRVLSGTRANGHSPVLGGAADAPADITLVNYDILAARQPELSALGPRALVLDESHFCKNPGAKRTQAAQRLAASVPADGLVLALTGTPVMNRPPELIAQLRLIGRLRDFGSGVQFGRRFRGPDANLRLHWHLRARCFVRRLKADVLPQLPAKTRAVVPIELDNEPEYRLAERDVVAWLQSQPLDLGELDARVAAALRAERLVRLNALKLLAARGKLHAALAWIHDFASSGERLVVFAHHREIQRAVIERFPGALHLLGQDSHAARDAALRAFQAPDDEHNQLIVCSLEVAGQGLTLTRASNVAFLELDWTPAKHDQAEDRCHRIGQQDAVNASYLLAANTIDETIATLLERKRAVIGAVTDGREDDEQGVLDALVRELRGAPYRHLRVAA
jgi:SWI/SNF-related matrix-associated actin-dependent regulator 1 of chromatin subfamily A